jgi:hypothetical protein
MHCILWKSCAKAGIFLIGISIFQGSLKFEPMGQFHAFLVELVSKELNHLAAILHVYAGGLKFMK